MRRPHPSKQKTSVSCEVCGAKQPRRLRRPRDVTSKGLFACPTCWAWEMVPGDAERETLDWILRKISPPDETEGGAR